MAENISDQQITIPVYFQRYNPYPFDYLYPTVDATTTYPSVSSVTIGGADANKFRLDTRAAPRFYSYDVQGDYSHWDVTLVQSEAFDYEAPSDANRDGTYEVNITVIDNAGNSGTSPIFYRYLIDSPESSNPSTSTTSPTTTTNTTSQLPSTTVDPITGTGGVNQGSASTSIGNIYKIPFGQSGTWKPFKKTKGRDVMWDFEKRRVKGKMNQFAWVDNDVQIIENFDPDTDTLRLPGNWENYSIAPFLDSTFIYIGNNVVANISGLNYDRASAGLYVESY